MALSACELQKEEITRQVSGSRWVQCGTVGSVWSGAFGVRGLVRVFQSLEHMSKPHNNVLFLSRTFGQSRRCARLGAWRIGARMARLSDRATTRGGSNWTGRHNDGLSTVRL